MNYEYLHSFVFFFILILSSCFLKFQMGLATSFLMGNGSPTTQMLNLITGSLYTSFVEKETDTFPQFHQAFLDIFNTFNSALPGKHYDVPARPEVKECFDKWKESTDEAKKKKIFVDFIKEKVKLNEPHKSTLITGIVTPPAAMVAKKAGERVPALKLIKVVPDVLFVPSATFLALISVKVSRKVFHNRMLKKDQEREQQTNI